MWLLRLLFSAGLSAQTLDSPDAFSLPQRLQASGQYQLCAVEQLRVGFTHPALELKALEGAMLCLQLDNQPTRAQALFAQTRIPAEALRAHPMLVWRLCTSDLLSTPHALTPACLEALSLFSTEPGRSGGDESPSRELLGYLPRMSGLLAVPLDWQPLPSQGIPEAWIEADGRAVTELRAHRPKRAWVAGLLSALIPGLGRVYVGNTMDGVASFLMVGIPAGISIARLATEPESTFWPYVVLGSAAVLYAGNVYGSAIGANVYNEAFRQKWRAQTLATFRERLVPPPITVASPGAIPSEQPIGNGSEPRE